MQDLESYEMNKAVIRWLAEEPVFMDGRRFHEREPPHYKTEAERAQRLEWMGRDPRVLFAQENSRRVDAQAAEYHAQQGPGYAKPVIGGTPVSGQPPATPTVPAKTPAPSAAVPSAAPAGQQPRGRFWRRVRSLFGG